MSDRHDPNRSLLGDATFISVLGLLGVMVVMATLLAISELGGIAARQQATSEDSSTTTPARAQSRQLLSGLLDVTPETPWKPLSEDRVLSKIGLGSCLHQNHPMPIWETVLANEPELFLMLGDNVYGDIRNGDPNELASAYRKLGSNAEFAKARAAFPFLAIWDDHDYGTNDGGANYEFQPEAAAFFRQFWGLDDAHQTDGGIYHSRVIGPTGRRVQFIFLDVRTFKSPFARKEPTFPYWGKYQPDEAAEKTILGEAQWTWLRAQLAEDADIKIIASGIQVLANGHGWERWGNLPAERDKLIETIRESGAGGIIFVSGDRHAGAHYQQAVTPNASGQTIIPELTASSLNRSFGPSQDAQKKPLVSGPHHVENFGLIEIDWERQRITFRIKGRGDLDDSQTLSFAELGTGIGAPIPAAQ